ncbi:uncharacterized protein LOC121861713 [Homarus americanus]|uniref:Uncharacterized protein n=1 Tax=Homarus americanus TaxID=6706 RepID=A0A8J5T4D7_HOMAM|nr:uncharacterized protein LOC121861713 [Homarus americanus]KAG7172501.1 hypothetical protein Hamer_G022707 [Homarus americanus]
MTGLKVMVSAILMLHLLRVESKAAFGDRIISHLTDTQPRSRGPTDSLLEKSQGFPDAQTGPNGSSSQVDDSVNDSRIKLSADGSVSPASVDDAVSGGQAGLDAIGPMLSLTKPVQAGNRPRPLYTRYQKRQQKTKPIGHAPGETRRNLPPLYNRNRPITENSWENSSVEHQHPGSRPSHSSDYDENEDTSNEREIVSVASDGDDDDGDDFSDGVMKAQSVAGFNSEKSRVTDSITQNYESGHLSEGQPGEIHQCSGSLTAADCELNTDGSLTHHTLNNQVKKLSNREQAEGDQSLTVYQDSVMSSGQTDFEINDNSDTSYSAQQKDSEKGSLTSTTSGEVEATRWGSENVIQRMQTLVRASTTPPVTSVSTVHDLNKAEIGNYPATYTGMRGKRNYENIIQSLLSHGTDNLLTNYMMISGELINDDTQKKESDSHEPSTLLSSLTSESSAFDITSKIRDSFTKALRRRFKENGHQKRTRENANGRTQGVTLLDVPQLQEYFNVAQDIAKTSTMEKSNTDRQDVASSSPGQYHHHPLPHFSTKSHLPRHEDHQQREDVGVPEWELNPVLRDSILDYGSKRFRGQNLNLFPVDNTEDSLGRVEAPTHEDKRGKGKLSSEEDESFFDSLFSFFNVKGVSGEAFENSGHDKHSVRGSSGEHGSNLKDEQRNTEVTTSYPSPKYNSQTKPDHKYSPTSQYHNTPLQSVSPSPHFQSDSTFYNIPPSVYGESLPDPLHITSQGSFFPDLTPHQEDHLPSVSLSQPQTYIPNRPPPSADIPPSPSTISFQSFTESDSRYSLSHDKEYSAAANTRDTLWEFDINSDERTNNDDGSFRGALETVNKEVPLYLDYQRNPSDILTHKDRPNKLLLESVAYPQSSATRTPLRTVSSLSPPTPTSQPSLQLTLSSIFPPPLPPFSGESRLQESRPRGFIRASVADNTPAAPPHAPALVIPLPVTSEGKVQFPEHINLPSGRRKAPRNPENGETYVKVQDSRQSRGSRSWNNNRRPQWKHVGGILSGYQGIGKPLRGEGIRRPHSKLRNGHTVIPSIWPLNDPFFFRPQGPPGHLINSWSIRPNQPSMKHLHTHLKPPSAVVNYDGGYKQQDAPHLHDTADSPEAVDADAKGNKNHRQLPESSGAFIVNHSRNNSSSHSFEYFNILPSRRPDQTQHDGRPSFLSSTPTISPPSTSRPPPRYDSFGILLSRQPIPHHRPHQHPQHITNPRKSHPFLSTSESSLTHPSLNTLAKSSSQLRGSDTLGGRVQSSNRIESDFIPLYEVSQPLPTAPTSRESRMSESHAKMMKNMRYGVNGVPLDVWIPIE